MRSIGKLICQTNKTVVGRGGEGDRVIPTKEQKQALAAIREKKTEAIVAGRLKRSNPIPRSKQNPPTARVIV